MRVSCDTVIYGFSKENEPICKIRSGDTISIETKDCFSNQLCDANASFDKLDWGKINPATGPIFIEEADIGDTLKVTINSIEINKSGVIACIENEGAVGNLIDGVHHKVLDIADNHLIFDENISIPIKPMIGVIGVAPNEEMVPTGTPGHHGGNMDNNMICEGTTLYLPVSVKGGLFALGDLHAVMGDGEVCVCGLEIPGVVNVTLEVMKNKKEDYPVLETDTTFSVIVSKETLDEASVTATELMVKFLQQRTNYSVVDISMLLSLIGNLEICQIVDPLKTVRFVIPKHYFKGIAF